MSISQINTDYLVIGAGAAGLAFVDTLITQTDAHVTLVDRRGQPGGHWNDAYPFVTLHQPSAFYGVNSMELGHRRKDRSGLNQGLYELATGAEITAYFDRVVRDKLLPSGRVSYHPMCNVLQPGETDRADGSAYDIEHDTEHGIEIESLLSGRRTRVNVRKRVVDATNGSPSVPATHKPRFDVLADARLVPPNALPQLWRDVWPGDKGAHPPRHFVVVGAGKTAMDAVIWLMHHGASPDAIQWVMPRDSWLVNRITTQPAPEFFNEAIGGQADQLQACAEATSVDDLYLRLEACGVLLRIDPTRTPTMFHLGTITPAEAAELRRVQQVIRMGHVLAVGPRHMELQQGRVEVPERALFIDCSASAVEPRPTQPIFQSRRILLQLVRLPQPAFSAALVAYVEAHYEGDKQKNSLCTTVPFPYQLADYPRALIANMWNQFQWGQDKALRQWIRESRLDGLGRLMSGVDPQDTAAQATLARFKQYAAAAMANLPKLLQQG